MSGMFDVDCPRTPDGDDNKKSNDGKASNSRPPLPSSRSGSSNVVLVSALPTPARPLGATTASSSRTTTRRAQFTPRPRGGGAKRSLGKGIEPEEYIVTPAAMPPPPTSTSVPRGHTSARSAAHHVSIPCSTNPFDVENGEGDKYFGLGAQEKQQFYGPSRNDVTTAVTTTTNPSVSIQQHQDHHNKINDQQNTAMDSPGNNNNHSTLTTPTINAAAPSSVVDDYSFSNVFTNINLTSPGNQSPGGTLLTGHHHHHHHSSDHHIEKRSKIRDTLIEWYGRTFPNKADKYTPPNLDYETNLAPRGVNYGGTTTSQNEWVVSNSFAPNGIYVKHDTSYTHRRREVMKMSLGVMVMVVMCTIFGVTISELKKANAALPKVGGSGSPLNGMVPVPLTDLSSTRIEPITARPTTLAPASLAPATLAPSDSPTLAPLSVSPTKPPLTRSPVAGNYALHVKTSDGTAWPTRSPRTSRPSNKPSKLSDPTKNEETTTNPRKGKRGKRGGGIGCTDDADRFFLNHLNNHKNCEWLENGKVGYTDRKDKNCGGRSVVDEDTGKEIIYDTTELGLACRKTCELYNGCADLEDEDTANGIEERLAGVDVGDEVLDLEIDNNDVDSSSSSCQDSPGKFLNHNSHLKDCVWLHNNKDGISDRKDMNCGGRSVEDASTGGVIIYVTTELGLACRQTCALYNGCADAEDMKTAENGIEERLGDVDNENEEDNDEVEEEELDEDEVDENAEDDDDDDDDEEEELHSIAKSIAKDNVIMRSYSSPLISYSLTTTCVDGTGEYMDHKLSPKPCKWLEEASEHQQSINCGSEKYGITELGMECPWSCREYNDCE